MATSREQAVAELRRSIDVLPERTRKAMLVGLGNNTVITGAFSGGGGACPMLVAHREGARTSCCSFPEAWDKFTGVAGRQIVRAATEYEVQILRREIEASLLPAAPSMFAEAIAEHQATVEARRREESIAEQQPATETRRRRLRITGGERIDLTAAIDEHRSSARGRRSRVAAAVGRGWLFEETLVLPDDFGQEPVAPQPEDGDGEFDFDAADAEMTR
jgi:hypothetical protein